MERSDGVHKEVNNGEDAAWQIYLPTVEEVLATEGFEHLTEDEALYFIEGIEQASWLFYDIFKEVKEEEKHGK